MKKMFETAVIFRIFDYITLKSLQNIRFSLPIGFKAIAKGDGYFVILGSEKPDFVKIELANYNDILIEKSNIADNMMLWLKPKLNSFSEIIKCEKQQGKQAFAYKSDDLRLLLDKAENENEITIFTEKKLVLEGRKILLACDDVCDVASVICEEKNKLVISNVSRKYPKIKTQVYLLFECEQESEEIIQVPTDGDYKIIYV